MEKEKQAPSNKLAKRRKVGEMITKAEAMEYLDISKKMIEKLMKAREIPYYKISRNKVYFSIAELDDFIKSYRVKSYAEMEQEAGRIYSL